MRFFTLIHDHDTKFIDSFEIVFESVNIPYRAPNANTHAKKRVRTVREKYLGKVIILHSYGAEHVHEGLLKLKILLNSSQYRSI